MSREWTGQNFLSITFAFESQPLHFFLSFLFFVDFCQNFYSEVIRQSGLCSARYGIAFQFDPIFILYIHNYDNQSIVDTNQMCFINLYILLFSLSNLANKFLAEKIPEGGVMILYCFHVQKFSPELENSYL